MTWMPTLTGNRCICLGCRELFNSPSIFERHRVGDWMERGAHRRCLTVPEMVAKGWVKNAAGFWIRARNDGAPWHRTDSSGDRVAAA